MIITVRSLYYLLMISALKTTFSLNNLKILRPEVTKNIMNLRKKFCESPPGKLKNMEDGGSISPTFSGLTVRSK